MKEFILTLILLLAIAVLVGTFWFASYNASYHGTMQALLNYFEEPYGTPQVTND